MFWKILQHRWWFRMGYFANKIRIGFFTYIFHNRIVSDYNWRNSKLFSILQNQKYDILKIGRNTSRCNLIFQYTSCSVWARRLWQGSHVESDGSFNPIKHVAFIKIISALLAWTITTHIHLLNKETIYSRSWNVKIFFRFWSDKILSSNRYQWGWSFGMVLIYLIYYRKYPSCLET